MHSVVKSHITSYSVQVGASAQRVVETLSGQVQEMAAHPGAQMLHAVEDVTRQLRSEIKATAMSMAMTAEINTHTTIEGMCRDISLQIDQNHKDAWRKDEKNRHRMDNIATGLERLTKQLNDFKPARETMVGDSQKQIAAVD